MGAKFDIGVLGMRFGYFLMLTHEPKYNTLTWTLDYRYNSDFGKSKSWLIKMLSMRNFDN